MTVITRFPPSPTGFLHVGGARTALFNWLYARHHGGKMRLRIEDTDRKRSTDAAIDAIIEGMKWLELDWDGDIVFQSRNADRHAAVAAQLLDAGKAYRCYCTPEELAEMRDTARKEGRPTRYDGRWRDRDPNDAPADIAPVVRIKMPQSGQTTIQDKVQGDVTVSNDQLDDFILLRADGSPTYMLSVVADDHAMEITHIIRGDDHLNNAFRQQKLFEALDWPVPQFAHIPLIHGADGQKLSKRHGALGVEAYRDMGYLPEAMRNYLLRLGWSHGDDETIDTEHAIEWFDLDGVGRSAARFDLAKLENMNGHYISVADDARLLALILPLMSASLPDTPKDQAKEWLLAGIPQLKIRAKTINELAENAMFYVARPQFPLANAKAAKLLQGNAPRILSALEQSLANTDPWSAEQLELHLREVAGAMELGLGKLAQPLRAALTGSNASPSIFEIMEIFGKPETLERISSAQNTLGDA